METQNMLVLDLSIISTLALRRVLSTLEDEMFTLGEKEAAATEKLEKEDIKYKMRQIHSSQVLINDELNSRKN